MASAQWKNDDILGATYRAYAPWIYSEIHGWLYESKIDDTEAWYYEPGSDWFYATSAAPDWLFSFKHGGWLQLVQHSPRIRWFWDYTAGGYDIEPGAQATALDRTVMSDIEFIAGRLRQMAADVPEDNVYPSTSPAGSLAVTTVGPNSWISGYFPSELWLMYELTSGSYWRDEAERRTAPLLAQADVPGVDSASPADMGSMLMEPFLHGWQLTGETQYADGLVKVATLYNNAYNDKVGGFRSWNWGRYSGSNFTIIMDATGSLLMNLVAYDLPGGQAVWYDRTITAADTVMSTLVRPDGGSFHLAIWQQSTGALIRKGTYQGYSDTSTWARGQSWGIRAFAMLAEHTGETRYADTSRKLADYFMARLKPDGVPPWDFDAPGTDPLSRRDTSAAAVTAAGLLKLSAVLQSQGDEEGAATYRADAGQLITALSDPTYLAVNADTDYVLLHGTANGPSNQFDQCLIYGDFHFLEALILYLKTEGLW